eukprot:COSAG05_NODE_21396_length_272_cov_0.601156_1_plen_71_part_01
MVVIVLSANLRGRRNGFHRDPDPVAFDIEGPTYASMSHSALDQTRQIKSLTCMQQDRFYIFAHRFVSSMVW